MANRLEVEKVINLYDSRTSLLYIKQEIDKIIENTAKEEQEHLYIEPGYEEGYYEEVDSFFKIIYVRRETDTEYQERVTSKENAEKHELRRLMLKYKEELIDGK